MKVSALTIGSTLTKVEFSPESEAEANDLQLYVKAVVTCQATGSKLTPLQWLYYDAKAVERWNDECWAHSSF